MAQKKKAPRKPSHADREQEAAAILRKVEQENHSIFGGAMRAASNHFSAKDVTSDDPAELWGKRIARFLALGMMLYLIYYFLSEFVFT